jgi:hypothetical protein
VRDFVRAARGEVFDVLDELNAFCLSGVVWKAREAVCEAFGSCRSVAVTANGLRSTNAIVMGVWRE